MTQLESFTVASGRTVGATAAVPSVCAYLVGSADASFEIFMAVLVTTSTTHSFSCQCAYTDEGNTGRTATMPFRLLADTTQFTSIVAASAAVPYVGLSLFIRAKANTTITLLTQAAGTYTTVTFNVEGFIRKLAAW